MNSEGPNDISSRAQELFSIRDCYWREYQFSSGMLPREATYAPRDAPTTLHIQAAFYVYMKFSKNKRESIKKIQTFKKKTKKNENKEAILFYIQLPAKSIKEDSQIAGEGEGLPCKIQRKKIGHERSVGSQHAHAPFGIRCALIFLHIQPPLTYIMLPLVLRRIGIKMDLVAILVFQSCRQSLKGLVKSLRSK